MGFLEWLLEPFTDLGREEEELPKDDYKEKEIIWPEGTVFAPLEDCIIKDDELNFLNDEKNKGLFRPENFNEYIGQEKAKDILGDYIRGITKRKLVFPHTLIHGSAGMGKTTLAYIIAHQLKVKLVETITSDIIDFKDLKNNINACEGGILFLDEIHSITRETAEKMYTIMEDFKYKGESIQSFTLMGATTELGEIIKNRKPFYDRFKIIIELEEYNIKELVRILKQYKDNMFVSDKIHGRIFRCVALNCRGTPRTGIRLLEATIYANTDIKKVLKNFSIIKYGYTNKDLKLLEYMKKNNHPIGLQSIAAYLGTSQYNYLYEIEPYLLSNGIMTRTSRGRKISEDGIELIKHLRRK